MLLTDHADEPDGERQPDEGEDLEDDHDGEGDPAEAGSGAEYGFRHVVMYVCTDYQAHGHRPRWTRSSEVDDGEPATQAEAGRRAEAAKQQRRETIEHNKA